MLAIMACVCVLPSPKVLHWVYIKDELISKRSTAVNDQTIMSARGDGKRSPDLKNNPKGAPSGG